MWTVRFPQGSLSKRPKRFVLCSDDPRLSMHATCPLLLPKGRCTAWGGVGFPTFCPRTTRRVEGVVLGAAGAMHYSLTHERRLASARFWGHRDRMMSGSTTPSIHNQRFIGMHQHYWTQRYRLPRSLSDNIGTVQPSFILDAQCWAAGANHISARAPGTGPIKFALLQPTTTTPHPQSGWPSPFMIAHHIWSPPIVASIKI